MPEFTDLTYCDIYDLDLCIFCSVEIDQLYCDNVAHHLRSSESYDEHEHVLATPGTRDQVVDTVRIIFEHHTRWSTLDCFHAQYNTLIYIFPPVSSSANLFIRSLAKPTPAPPVNCWRFSVEPSGTGPAQTLG